MNIVEGSFDTVTSTANRADSLQPLIEGVLHGVI